MRIWKFVVSQFGKPEGLFGKLAGFIMSTRPSNIERSDWGISLLDVKQNITQFIIVSPSFLSTEDPTVEQGLSAD